MTVKLRGPVPGIAQAHSIRHRVEARCNEKVSHVVLGESDGIS